MQTVLWSPKIGDVNVNVALINNYAATTDPGVSNDITQGYSVGSNWYNSSDDVWWVCVSAAEGAAEWQVLTTGGGTPGQVVAPAAAGATDAGGAALIKGGAGGATSGAGGASTVQGGAATGGNSAGGAGVVVGGAGHGSSAGGAVSATGGVGGATGAGGAASVTGGAGGATSGAGGVASVSGGAGSAGNANGGSVLLAGGAKNGTGIVGGVSLAGIVITSQGNPTAKTVSATLTAAEILTGIITGNQGGAAAASYQLPLATDLVAALPPDAWGTDKMFRFYVINISTDAAETVTLTTNTGWTLVGKMVLEANTGTSPVPSGMFGVRQTGAGALTLYRLS